MFREIILCFIDNFSSIVSDLIKLIKFQAYSWPLGFNHHFCLIPRFPVAVRTMFTTQCALMYLSLSFREKWTFIHYSNGTMLEPKHLLIPRQEICLGSSVNYLNHHCALHVSRDNCKPFVNYTLLRMASIPQAF